MSDVVRWLETPAIDLPLTATITSPRRRPAFWAGEPGNTRLIRRPAGTSVTSMPTPENSPCEESW